MFFDSATLKRIHGVLYEAARTRSFWCEAPRLDAAGKDGWNGPKGVVPYGPHGVGFVEIDPETEQVRCGACAGTKDATAKPKVAVNVRGRGGVRTHYVSR